MNRFAAAAVLSLVMATPAASQTPEQARAILETTPLIDGHNDLPWALRQRFGSDVHGVDLTQDQSSLEPPLHTDIPRLRSGGVGAQFWSVYVPASMEPLEAARATFEQIDVVNRLIAAHPGAFEFASTADDVERIHGEGRIASLIGIEGGYSIADSMGLLRQFFDAGVRYMTLTHSTTTSWADSATDAPQHRGLTPFGEEVVREMNRLGMLVDLSHVSEATMTDAMRVSEAPVIFSHSSARAVTAHPRNVPDAVLSLLPDDGGVVMVTFVPGFVNESVRAHGAAASAERARLEALNPGSPDAVARGVATWSDANPAPVATIADVADHIDHIRRVAGVDHVGLGGDFDGVGSLPDGLTGVETYPALLADLMRRGWSEADIRKLAGENVLRVMRAAEATAARMADQPPSLARIDD